MTNEEIDALWNRAIGEAIKKGEDFTRYEFYRMVAAANSSHARVAWTDMAYARLGMARDRMTSEAVKAVQDFLSAARGEA